MSNSASSQPQQLFCSGQIVALDNTNSVFYGEIIQTIPQRQMCWVRAIALSLKARDWDVTAKLPGSENQDSETQIIDLHRNVDLLFPLDLFRVAFDTELIPLLSKIDLSHHSCLNDTQTSRQYLNQFLKEIWQINQSKFQV